MNQSLGSSQSAVLKLSNPVIGSMSPENRSWTIFCGPGKFWRFARFRSEFGLIWRIAGDFRGFARFSEDFAGFGRIFGDFGRFSGIFKGFPLPGACPESDFPLIFKGFLIQKCSAPKSGRSVARTPKNDKKSFQWILVRNQSCCQRTQLTGGELSILFCWKVIPLYGDTCYLIFRRGLEFGKVGRGPG